LGSHASGLVQSPPSLEPVPADFDGKAGKKVPNMKKTVSLVMVYLKSTTASR